jgi:hypothetical protein
MSVNELDMFFSYSLALAISSPFDDPIVTARTGSVGALDNDPDWTPAL